MPISALSTKLSKLNRSGYRGVSWYAPKSQWRAAINFNHKYIHLGYFDDVHDAGIAASNFRLQHADELEINQERARQLKAQANRKHLAGMTLEERRERVRENFASTAEERSERAKKGWETKHRNTLI